MSVYDDARSMTNDHSGHTSHAKEVAQGLIDLVADAEWRADCAVWWRLERCGGCRGCRLDATLRRIREETT